MNDILFLIHFILKYLVIYSKNNENHKNYAFKYRVEQGGDFKGKRMRTL